MKNKSILIAFCVFVVGVAWFVMSNPKMRKSEMNSASRITQKCPDDFANDDAGEAEYLAAINKWTNNFFDSHPGASLGDWERARHQFWVDNHCVVALQRYQEAKSGKADPAIMKLIKDAVQKAVGVSKQ